MTSTDNKWFFNTTYESALQSESFFKRSLRDFKRDFTLTAGVQAGLGARSACCLKEMFINVICHRI